ncbi:Bug family tripartite tricarboxylate transporter substrate binding protein [Ottowia sp.]|uniref:Bug family tripartite tricarboxylate transporter substrate binding protein n=1 Tax=Ottowia sp. TaxID=1898956 RepID=UPI003A86FAC6
MQRNAQFIVAIATAVAAFTAQAAGPDGYPSRPVPIIVPFSPGGDSDNVARIVASRLTERTGASFIIENKPGAGTNIANELASRAKPDGQTLLFGQVTLSINPTLYKNLKYDVRKNFTPVAHIANSPTVLVINQALPVQSVQDLMALAKSKPNALNYGSGGKGTSVHLAGELFTSITGVSMTHISYKGSAPAMTDLIGGQIQMIFDTAPSALDHIKGGKVKALAVSGPKRLTELPSVPTFAEAGVPTFDAPAWYGLLAPAGTPGPVLQWLNQEVEHILHEPATQQKLLQMGAVPAGGSTEAFGDFIQAESDRWRAVIDKNRITSD